MADLLPLSEKTAAEIDALAGKISVAHRLDGEIQAELRGHVEDKVRGYVSGEVKVTEADALLLAKAHFGEAAVIKTMFQGVHEKEHVGSLARRLVAAFVAMVLAYIAAVMVEVAWKYCFFPPEQQSYMEPIFPIVLTCLALIIAIVETCVLWIILSTWRKREARGIHEWFNRCHPLSLALIVLITAGAQCAVAYARDAALSRLTTDAFTGLSIRMPSITLQAVVAGWGIVCIAYVAKALVWLWWTDRTPFTWRATSTAVVSWIAVTQWLALVGGASVLLSRGMWNGEEFETPLRVLGPSMWLSLRVEGLMGLLAIVAYLSARRRALPLRRTEAMEG